MHVAKVSKHVFFYLSFISYHGTTTLLFCMGRVAKSNLYRFWNNGAWMSCFQELSFQIHPSMQTGKTFGEQLICEANYLCNL